MCGICGIYNFDGQPVDRVLLENMNRTMVHRGPDDEGYHVDESVGLAHRRLSIIDLSSGHQPIYNEDGSKVIVFNGEIYNFLQIKRELETLNHLFKTRSDTEVIVHAYEEWGTDCLKRLRGMFALAIWDNKQRSLFLARDRLGIKPLYYLRDNKRIVFSSELKAILVDPSVPREIDLEALSDYLSLGYIPWPKTIFKSIRKLPPGYYMIDTLAKTILHKYWDLNFEPDREIPERVLCDRILETLEESVRMRLISEVPLGAFLSGGIDSSVVVALMSRLMNEPVKTNSVGFRPREKSELDSARKTANLFRTEHHEYEVTPNALDVIERLSWHFDEPFADSSAIPTYYVSKMARENVTVAMSGDGGDENFAGYRRYFYDRLENRIRAVLPTFIRRSVAGSLARAYPKADWLPQALRAKTLLTNVSLEPIEGYFNSMSFFLPEMKKKIMSGDLRSSLRGYDSAQVFRHHYDNAGIEDPLARIQYVDFKTYLVDDILTKVDRASMAVSLEVRVPILDHKFVELVATIPSPLKLNGRMAKYIFKKSAEKILPRDIIQRKKMGFTIPVDKWLRRELAPLVQDTLLNRQFAGRGLFDVRYVQKLWREHRAGIRDSTQPLWALLNFELWAKRFLDK